MDTPPKLMNYQKHKLNNTKNRQNGKGFNTAQRAIFKRARNI